MERTASCACGALSVRVEGEPSAVAVCNCLQCQKRTGSVFGVGAYYPNEQVLEKSGKSQAYERSSDSGRKIVGHFCPICGSTVFWEPEFLKRHTGVAVGCFASPDFPTPGLVAWSASKHDWVRFPDQCLVSEAQDFSAP